MNKIDLSVENVAWCTDPEREYYNRVVDAALNHRFFPGRIDRDHSNPEWVAAFYAAPVEQQVLYWRTLLKTGVGYARISKLLVDWATRATTYRR